MANILRSAFTYIYPASWQKFAEKRQKIKKIFKNLKKFQFRKTVGFLYAGFSNFLVICYGFSEQKYPKQFEAQNFAVGVISELLFHLFLTLFWGKRMVVLEFRIWDP